MQKIDLRNKSYKHLLVKNESEAITKNYIFDFFSIENSFGLLLQVPKYSKS